MIIALDYDGTYTADPDLFEKFICAAHQNNHEVICFTMRKPEEKINGLGLRIEYTSRQAKKIYADLNGIKVDIWIDDKPAWLFEDAL